MIRVTVWNENLSETKYEDVAALFPKGIHGYLAVLFGKEADLDVRTATMDQPENGLPDEVLENTDVLIWWAHTGHHLVSDGVAWKVQQRVLRGMGLIVLHSAHLSKPFQLLMGTSCTLKWRDGDFERLWTVLPNHPIAQGVGEFIGWFSGGEVFRSGCCWNRGLGRVFYFQPGHESNTAYFQAPIQRILLNAVRWAAPSSIAPSIECPQALPSPEELRRQRAEKA